MRARALFSLLGALIVAVALVSASGAATTKAQKIAKIDVSTRAAVIHYLRSIHVNPKGAVIQRGARNYAGARCPGGRWTCASARHTVVQIAKRGGQNRFVCRSSKCVVVQLASVSHGLYFAGRSLASTAAPSGGNSASCIKTTGLVQSCVISQSNSAGNTATVVEGQVAPGQKATGLTQTASYAAQITQTSTSGLNKACVLQVTNMDGSTNMSGKKAQPISVTLEAHQSILITQDSSHGDNSARAATPAGGCDDTNGSAVTQQQVLSSTATGSGSITQKEDAANNGFNLSLDIEQNQQTPSASGSNAAIFTQTSNQSAVAVTPAGPVSQTQTSPSGGIVAAVNQNSTGLSNFTATQNEVQCEDAQKPQPPETAGCHTNDPDNPFGSALTQTQYGPIGMTKLLKHSQRRVGYSVHKTPGDSHQTGNLNDTFTVTQSSHQDNDTTSGQSNNVSGGVNTSGGGTVTQNTLIQGSGKTDVQAGTNTNVAGTINCPTGGSSCTKTLSAPKIVSKPSDPATFGSTTFTFKNVDPTVIFACSLDNAVYTTCTGGVQVNQTGALGTQNYSNLASGQHTFSVKTKDAENGQLSSGADSFTWVITPPDPSIGATKPPNPDSFGASESISFSDLDGTAKFKCSLDGATPSVCTSPVSLPALASGSHTFSVRAYDTTLTYPSNNAVAYTWVITPPDPTISSGPDSQTTSTDATFTFADDDSTVLFKCNLDSAGYSDCPSSNPTYSDLSHGTHTLVVKAMDQSGTYSSTGVATYSWEVIPYLTFEWDGAGASAGWSGAPGLSPINLTVGSPSATTYAQFTIHDRNDLAISGLAEPTFTTDTYSGGSPRYEIDFSDGNYAFGYPSQAGFGSASWELVQCDNSGCGSAGFMSWPDVQTAEGSATVTDALIEADGGQSAGITDAITAFTFDGYSLSFFTD